MGRKRKIKFKNLEIACILNDVTFVELARVAGMGDSTIHAKRKGVKPFYLHECAKIVNFFNKEFRTDFTIDELFKEVYDDVQQEKEDV